MAVALFLSAMIFITVRQSSPVASVERTGGTIRSVMNANAKYMPRNGFLYSLWLDNNQGVVSATQSAFYPPPVGAHVELERVTRENGSVFYRFPGR
jgi:hypothetical protein